MATGERYCFGPDRRLLQAQEFERVFSQARYKAQQSHLMALAVPSQQAARLGLVVAKRKVRLAHNRNRIKRAVRESFRHEALRLPALDVVVLAKGGAGELSVPELSAELSHLWRQLTRKVQGSSDSSR